jgi:hypothetical protein
VDDVAPGWGFRSGCAWGLAGRGSEEGHHSQEIAVLRYRLIFNLACVWLTLAARNCMQASLAASD